jgi:chromosome segregation ATPase
MNSILNPNPPKPPSQENGLIPEGIKLALLFVLVLAVALLAYYSISSKNATQAELGKIQDKLQSLENNSKQMQAALSSQVSTLKSDLAGVGNTQNEFKSEFKTELKKTAAQTQAEVQKTKHDLSQALAGKADTSQVEAKVQAVKTETERTIGRVTSEVGGVKSEVGGVKTDVAGVKNEVSVVKGNLEATRRDLEGTQRQLVDVHETLNAAIAKNATELAQLRLKGERNYFEFAIGKKNVQTKVEDIRLVLTNTDYKKGKYSLKIYVDDSQLEKKDRLINEPLQFLVGHNGVRYEIVVNYVQKDQVGGYLSIPKDKSLSAERPKSK